MHLIRRSEEPLFMDRVKEALNQVKGGFAYLLLTENAMIAALDPNGFRPLSTGKWSMVLMWWLQKPVRWKSSVRIYS